MLSHPPCLLFSLYIFGCVSLKLFSPCGLLFEWIFSSVSGAISQRTGDDSELCCWPSTQTFSSRLHELRGPNQVQALYIDCLKVLLFFLLQKRFSKRVGVWCLSCHSGLLVLPRSHSRGVRGGVVVLVRFHHRKFYTVLLNEKVSDFLSRAEGGQMRRDSITLSRLSVRSWCAHRWQAHE